VSQRARLRIESLACWERRSASGTNLPIEDQTGRDKRCRPTPPPLGTLHPPQAWSCMKPLPSSADGTTASRPQRDEHLPMQATGTLQQRRSLAMSCHAPYSPRALGTCYYCTVCMYSSDMPSSGCQPSGSRHNQTRGAWLLKGRGRVSAASEAANRNGAPNLVHFPISPASALSCF
jgi:hypothetical protein